MLSYCNIFVTYRNFFRTLHCNKNTIHMNICISKFSVTITTMSTKNKKLKKVNTKSNQKSPSPIGKNSNYTLKNRPQKGRKDKNMQLKQFAIQIIETIIGSFIMAIAVSLFLLPNELSSGGFSGIATITYYIFKIPMGTTILALNIPLFLLATVKIGRKFLEKSIMGTISLSIFIDILDRFEPLTNDKILACVYGGILTRTWNSLNIKGSFINWWVRFSWSFNKRV